MSAGRAANRIRAARIIRAGDERVVGTLAIGAADRVNGCHVQGVEAHRRDRRQARLGLAEGRATRGIGALRAGEDFVPGRKATLQPIHDHQQLVPVTRGVAAVRPAVHCFAQLGGYGQLGSFAPVDRAPALRIRLQATALRVIRRPLGRLVDQSHALEQL